MGNKMRKLLVLSGLILSIAVGAGEAELKSALLPRPVTLQWQLEQLVSGTTAPERFAAVDPKAIGVECSEQMKRRGNDVADLQVRLKNTSSQPLLLKLSVTAAIPFPQFTWWNGYLNQNRLKFDPDDNNLSNWFPVNAAYDAGSALILGLDPLMLCSRIISDRIQENGMEKLLVALPVYLEPGKTFEANLTAAAVPARYGYHDVIQGWYELFPAAFRPAAQIDPDVISGETSYLYWKPENFDYHFTGDLIRRFFGGRGSWEWCYKPFIRGGDWAISEQWSTGWGGYTKEQVARHRENIRRRLTPAEFQNVAPMWYLNVSWTEWDMGKKHFPEIALFPDEQKRRCWGQDTLYGIYPWGTPYGNLFLESLKRIPLEYSQSRGVGWDSCFAHRGIGPEHAGFKNSDPKSFEAGRPLALEAVGVAQLLDYNHLQFSGPYRMANAVNFKLVSPYMIGVRTDAGLYEGHPMGHTDRLLRIESMRARLGAPKALIWHKGASPDELRWIDWDDLTPAEAVDAYRQVMDNIRFLSYYWGAVPAPIMPALGIENMVKAIPELVDLIRHGWQPSPAVDVPDTILAARYGQGPGSRIVLINPEAREQQFKIFFPPHYWNGDAVLITGAPNHPVCSEITTEGTEAAIQLPARSVLVLRICGVGKLPKHKIEVTGEQIANPGKTPFHRLVLKTGVPLQWPVTFFRGEPGAPVRVSCESDVKRFTGKEPVQYVVDSAKWPADVQAANLNSGQLNLVEYPSVTADELDPETLLAMRLPEKVRTGQVIIQAPPPLLDEVERIAEWFRFYTMALTGRYSEPAINAEPGKDAVVISLELNRDELKDWQRGRAFAGDNRIRVVAADPAAGRLAVVAMLNQFDAAWPYYGVLPKTKALERLGLAGKTLHPAPVKKVLHPTLLEMMRSNRIK